MTQALGDSWVNDSLPLQTAAEKRCRGVTNVAELVFSEV